MSVERARRRRSVNITDTPTCTYACVTCTIRMAVWEIWTSCHTSISIPPGTGFLPGSPTPSLCDLLLQTRVQALSISTVNYVAPSWNTSPNSTRITCPFYSLLEGRFLLERVQDLLTVHSYLRPPPTLAKSWGCVVRYGVPKTPGCSCPTQPPAFHHGNAFFFVFLMIFFFLSHPCLIDFYLLYGTFIRI